MKRVYDAVNLPEAHLVRDLLEHAGIATHVFNTNAASSMGMIPVSAGCPQVWVVQPHQAQLALKLIAEYVQRSPLTINWRCEACGESNPGDFELCWHCGVAPH
jgi:hypothetical protein